MTASTDSTFLHGADLRQVAPVSFRVHAAAEPETVRNPQADEVRRDRLGTRERLLDQHRAVEGPGTLRPYPLADRAHRLAAVQDVVQHEHGTSLDAFGRPAPPLDAAAGGRGAVTRGGENGGIEREGEQRQGPPREKQPPAPPPGPPRG